MVSTEIMQAFHNENLFFFAESLTIRIYHLERNIHRQVTHEGWLQTANPALLRIYN